MYFGIYKVLGLIMENKSLNFLSDPIPFDYKI